MIYTLQLALETGLFAENIDNLLVQLVGRTSN